VSVVGEWFVMVGAVCGCGIFGKEEWKGVLYLLGMVYGNIDMGYTMVIYGVQLNGNLFVL
jgi:hypothetical protein